MTIQKIMQINKITRYRLSQESGVPYTTITDIYSGRTQLEKCSAETVYKLAKALNTSMDALIKPRLEQTCDFELYKSNVCHQVKEMGDIQFIIYTLEHNEIRSLYNRKEYPECLYLLAMLDYISRINDVPICKDYNDLRKCKLKEVIYPKSILTACSVSHKNDMKETAYKESIPEFIRFNIVENEVHNVI